MRLLIGSGNLHCVLGVQHSPRLASSGKTKSSQKAFIVCRHCNYQYQHIVAYLQKSFLTENMSMGIITSVKRIPLASKGSIRTVLPVPSFFH